MNNIIDTAVAANNFKILSADVMKLDGKTANGAKLKISTEGGVKLNGSIHITKTDIDCSNGVIHVVDAVLMSN